MRRVLKSISANLDLSRHIRRRTHPVQSLADLVELVDRFLVGDMCKGGRGPCDLEWDDFVSRPHADPEIERTRCRLMRHEHLLFSLKPMERLEYAALAIAERNRVAALIGQPLAETDAATRPVTE